jgi:NAD(P)-dependent dehydrogenase (short-subunit alcohol dehydrogenase family)
MEAAAMGRRMGALNGKVAIVTGGTSGIGEKIVEVFVEEGAQVVIAARRQAEGDALEKRLGARFVRTDVSSEADVKTMVDRAVEWFGRVDCLVNNAGIPAPITSVADMEVADIERVLAVNILGVMLATKHVARVMLTQGTGSIINIGSVAAHRGGLSGHIYTSSKGAVLAFTRSAAAELGEKGIRVNSISPGAIVTGIFGKLAGVEASKADRITDVVEERFAALQPVPRAGATDDIARAALYLAGDGSSFVSGQDIVVDGGLTSVTRGWSTMVALRAETSRSIKAAADSM